MNTRHNANKALVILSGGMDSTTLLYDLLGKGFECSAIGFNYGQRHSKELDRAKMICVALPGRSETNVPMRTVWLEDWADSLKGNALTDRAVEVPEGHYESESMKDTVVPMRNAVMLSMAISVASANGIGHVAIGVHAGDHAIYPDCRPEFIDSLQAMADRSLEGNARVGVMAPFINKRKTDIVRIGDSLGVPWDWTWSCYKGNELHCGKCGTCVERHEAFKEAGVKDPTVYECDEVEKGREVAHDG